MKDPYIAEMERTMPIPVTSFQWQRPGDSHEWAEEMQELLGYLLEKSQGSSVLFMPDGGRFDHGLKNAWRTAYDVLVFVCASSDPCETHILRGRILDVLETKYPEQDEFQGDVLACFGEAQHIVFTKERAL